jgi:hypothetical protein
MPVGDGRLQGPIYWIGAREWFWWSITIPDYEDRRLSPLPQGRDTAVYLASEAHLRKQFP